MNQVLRIPASWANLITDFLPAILIDLRLEGGENHLTFNCLHGLVNRKSKIQQEEDMFKMPTRDRLQLIMDMIPEIIAVLSQTGTGYMVRVSKLGEFMRLKGLASELGVKIIFTDKPNDPEYVAKVIRESKVPAFAVVASSIGRYHAAFADEECPAVELTRQFYEPCIDGNVYLVQEHEPTEREIKRLFASGAKSCSHLNPLTGELSLIIFH